MPSPLRAGTGIDRESFPDEVAVGIVSHNGLTKLPRSLEACALSGCSPERITVADVASDDGTGEWLRTTWPGVAVVRLPENRGPNPARNLLLTRGDTPFVLLMDDDVELRPDTVGALYRTLHDDPSIAVACPVAVHGLTSSTTPTAAALPRRSHQSLSRPEPQRAASRPPRGSSSGVKRCTRR
jgi:GT2 family glycosyltransferase